VAKKKREEQSRVVDGFIGLFATIFIGYLIMSGYQVFTNGSDFVKELLDYKTKYELLVALDSTRQMVFVAVVIGVTALFYTAMNKKPKGYKDASQHGAYGNSQFSKIEDLREDGFIAQKKQSKWSEKDPFIALGSGEGIVLGKTDKELIVIPPNSKLDNRNVLVVGSSGSSKGQAFVINNIINHRSQTIVVTDPKGELYGLTADIKRDQGFKVHQIDFLNLKGSRYNPLDYVTNDIEAIKIANAISINSAKDVKQDFFFNTAKDLLAGLIIYAINEYDKPNISKNIKGLFNKISSDEKFLPNLCEEIGDEHPAYQYLKDSSASTGNTRTSILSSFAQQTGVFSLSDVAKLTETSDFDFNELQEHKTILYVKIPVKDNPVPALTATFFDQIISTLYQIGDHNDSILPIPTIFLLDEFANLGKLNDYDNTLSTCRGYNMSMMTIVQDFAQLEGKYSKELARTIISNHDTTLFLRTKDTETAKYFERLAGETTIRYETNSTSNSGGLLYILGITKQSNASRSTNEQYIKKPLISESDLLSMKGDKAYVFMTGHRMELQKAFQSMIYKGFITGVEKKVIKGVERFPYVYPDNREKYIGHFNLIPYVDKVATTTIKEVKNTNSIELPVEINPIEETKLTIKEEPKKDNMESLINNFFVDVERKKKEAAVIKTEVPGAKKEKPQLDPMELLINNFFADTRNESSKELSLEIAEDELPMGETEETDATVVEETTTSESQSSNGGVTNLITEDIEGINEVASTQTEEIFIQESNPDSLAMFQSIKVLPKKIEETKEKEEKIAVCQNLISDLSLNDDDDDLMGELPM
jgi:type IV secretion system protein VirD4